MCKSQLGREGKGRERVEKGVDRHGELEREREREPGCDSRMSQLIYLYKNTDKASVFRVWEILPQV